MRFIPSLIKDYEIHYLEDGQYKKAAEASDNYQRLNNISLGEIETEELKLVFKETHGSSTFNLYSVRVL